MKKLVFVAALAAFGLLTGGAWAKTTTLHTTRADVHKQCGDNKNSCSIECGSAICNYDCEKSGCTVVILIEAPGGGNLGGGGKPSGNR